MPSQKRGWPKLMTRTIIGWHWEEATETRLQVFTKKNKWLPKIIPDEVITLADCAQEGIDTRIVIGIPLKLLGTNFPALWVFALRGLCC